MKKDNIKRLAVLLSAVFELTFCTSCAKEVPCEITKDHFHVYESKDGIKKYLRGEYEYYGFYDSFNRTEEYVLLDDSNSKILNFIINNSLINIVDNIDVIRKIEDNNKPCKEYEYTYITTKLVDYYVTTKEGKVIPMQKLVNITETDWTNDKNQECLTGNVREKSYLYYGYRVCNNLGILTLEESEKMSSIDELLSEGYYFIKTDFYEEIVKYNDEKQLILK